MYKKLYLASLFSVVTVLAFQTVQAQEPQNLEIVKQSYIKYHDSGAYLKDQAQVANQAMEYLKIRLEKATKNPPEKLAIVLDIDETALSNYNDMKRMEFGGTLEQIIQAEDKGTDTPIEPTLKLYRYAKQNNVAVFFVTGRTENDKQPTIQNLQNVGYQNWDGLFLKPNNYHEKSAAIYKTAVRQEIEKQGYKIVLNMGDQKSDLIGGHAEKTFKLPNPYYFIP